MAGMDELGKYRIEGLIAEGGMARIYRAKTEGVGGVEKVVALKCLKGAMTEDDELVQMLLDEARITVRMTHKNIGQVYGLEHVGETYFMVMELVDGINLATLCKYLFEMNRVFPMEAAVFITMEVCSGLSYAHRMTDDSGQPLGIVHRDVNPQNICISKEGEVKLIDFGIAKARIASSETQIGMIKGKFNYMSPEQARGERVDQRTDVFALGAVLYEMLCGHMLYPLSLDDAKLRTKSRMADFVPIESYLPNLPEQLKKILAKALTRDVNQRFASSRDFLLALTQFFHDSCKVYDALNLSSLVEKCLNHQDISAPKPSAQDTLQADHTLQMSVNTGSDFSESGDTTVINAEEARMLADVTSDDMKTDVFERPVINQDTTGLGMSSICRTVDLDIDTKNATARTLMVNMNEVENKKSAFSLKSLYDKIMAMNEKTLIAIAVGLTVLLVVAILLFSFVGQSPSIQDDGDVFESAPSRAVNPG